MEAVRIDPALVWGGGGCGLTALSCWRRVDAVSDVVVHVSCYSQSVTELGLSAELCTDAFGPEDMVNGA